MKIEQTQWTAPIYVVDSDDYPKVRIHLGGVGANPAVSPFDWRPGTPPHHVLNWFFQHGVDGDGWPIPPWARPDPSGFTDGHLIIRVRDTGHYAELNTARKLPDGDWEAHWGGYLPDVRTSPGTWSDNLVRNTHFRHSSWSASATGPMIHGIIREAEIRAAYAAWRQGDHARAVVPHALGISVHAHTKNTWVWPARRTDGTNVYGQGGTPIEVGPIENGQIFKLPDGFDPRSLTAASDKETALLQIIARTMQRYGAIVWDQTGAGLALRAEQVWTPSGLSQDMFDYGDAATWMQALPLEQLEAVETRNSVEPHYRPPPRR